jgi:hypothetical protein
VVVKAARLEAGKGSPKHRRDYFYLPTATTVHPPELELELDQPLQHTTKWIDD